jgi:glycine/D-amino acid oxidase-like deaminating enzyme
VSSILSDRDTAQVTPLEFTTKVFAEAEKMGAKLIIDQAVGVEMTENKITGVKTKESGTIEADQMIICLGPWSGVMVEDWFGLSMPMEGVKSTSLVYQNLESRTIELGIIQREPYAAVS